MPPVLDSLIPVFLVICLGWALKASNFVTEPQWDGIERVTYHVFIPALIITTMASADLSSVPVRSIGITLFVPIALITLGLLLVRQTLEDKLGIAGPAFSSLLQGAVRWNSFVAIALAAALHGKEGLTLIAVCMAFLFPAANFIAAYGLSRHASAAQLQLLPFLISLLKNPFIWSTFIGILIAISGLVLPKVTLVFGDIIGRATLAAGLLLVGSGLDLANLKKPGSALWISTIIKLVVYPLIAGSVGQAMGLSGTALNVLVITSAVPTAAGAYVLARQNGGDATLMASIITMQTLIAAATMPVMLWLFS